MSDQGVMISVKYPYVYQDETGTGTCGCISGARDSGKSAFVSGQGPRNSPLAIMCSNVPAR